MLGLVLLRGDEVIALTIEGPPPADALTAKIKAAAVRCCAAVKWLLLLSPALYNRIRSVYRKHCQSRGPCAEAPCAGVPRK